MLKLYFEPHWPADVSGLSTCPLWTQSFSSWKSTAVQLPPSGWSWNDGYSTWGSRSKDSRTSQPYPGRMHWGTRGRDKKMKPHMRKKKKLSSLRCYRCTWSLPDLLYKEPEWRKDVPQSGGWLVDLKEEQVGVQHLLHQNVLSFIQQQLLLNGCIKEEKDRKHISISKF